TWRWSCRSCPSTSSARPPDWRRSHDSARGRPVAPHRPADAARAGQHRSRRPAQGAARAAGQRARRRGGGGVHLQPGRGVRRRGTLPRRAVRRLGGAGPARRGGAARPGRAPVRALRGRRGGAPVYGGRRAGRDGAGRAADPRPAAGRVPAGRRRGRGRPGAARGVPAGAAGRQAGAHRHRHRPGRLLAGVHRAGRGGAHPRHAGRPVGAGGRRRVDGRAGRRHAAPGRGGAAGGGQPDAGQRAAAGPQRGRPGRHPGRAGRPGRRGHLVVAATGAAGVVLGYGAVQHAVEVRGGRPLVVLDLGLPRDTDPAVGALAGVEYVDIALLGERLAGTRRAADVPAARTIVAEEGAGYLAAPRAGEGAPPVTAPRARANQGVAAGRPRLDQRLRGLDGRVREELDRTVRRVVNTLLHAPTVRVKQLAEAPGGDVYAAALRELFELDPAAPQAVVTPTVALPDRFENGEGT